LSRIEKEGLAAMGYWEKCCMWNTLCMSARVGTSWRRHLAGGFSQLPVYRISAGGTPAPQKPAVWRGERAIRYRNDWAILDMRG